MRLVRAGRGQGDVEGGEDVVHVGVVVGRVDEGEPDELAVERFRAGAGSGGVGWTATGEKGVLREEAGVAGHHGDAFGGEEGR